HRSPDRAASACGGPEDRSPPAETPRIAAERQAATPAGPTVAAPAARTRPATRDPRSGAEHPDGDDGGAGRGSRSRDRDDHGDQHPGEPARGGRRDPGRAAAPAGRYL